VYQKRLNDWYEAHQTEFDPKEGCIGKLNHCNDRKICGKLHVNETVETHVTLACLSLDCLELKTDRMSIKLLHTESAARHKHHMQVKLEYCYIGKES
jgi:hypothetical protein